MLEKLLRRFTDNPRWFAYFSLFVAATGLITFLFKVQSTKFEWQDAGVLILISWLVYMALRRLKQPK